jgi:catechol 2,3-dioxygenase-like lactoylglutathione lyase family enzyme
MPQIASLDHLVLTVFDLDATVAFYEAVLGMTSEVFHPADGTRRIALMFGVQKINLHQARAEFEPKAKTPLPGSGDLCFLSQTPLVDWLEHFVAQNVPVLLGPVPRIGATGPLTSLYIRDPDGNLIEISNRV